MKIRPPFLRLAPFCILVYSFSTAFAQDAILDEDPTTRLFVKGGISQTFFRKSNNLPVWRGQYNQFVWNGGVAGTHQLLDFLAIRGELVYQQQASKSSNINILGVARNEKGVITHHTLQVPLLAELRIPGENLLLSPRLVVGGFYSYLLQSDYTFEQIYAQDTRVNGRNTITDSFERNQYGLMLGLIAAVDVGERQLQVEVRYAYTLSDINNSLQDALLNQTLSDYGGKIRPVALSLTVAYNVFQF